MISGSRHAPVQERLKAGHFNRLRVRRAFNLSVNGLQPGRVR